MALYKFYSYLIIFLFYCILHLLLIKVNYYNDIPATYRSPLSVLDHLTLNLTFRPLPS